MADDRVQTLENEIASITFTGGAELSSDDETSRTESSEREPTSPVGTEKLLKTDRFNPFDREEAASDVDLFPQLNSDVKQTAAGQRYHGVDSPDTPAAHYNVNGEDEEPTVDIHLSEDHFSLPEGVLPETSIAELEEAIGKYKRLVTECTENSERQKDLVTKLIQLRLQLAQAKEGPETVEADVKQVVGHKFVKKESVRAKHYCEQCSAVIWGVVSEWYRCKGCGFCCHAKCLNMITRTCALTKVESSPQFLLSICPEKGLSSQNYRCHECRAPISYQSGFGEPRRCDYTGSYYCNVCHWNDAVIVPARVLHNWDFEPRKVCRASKQFLKLMLTRSVLRLQDINPMLFVYVEELNQVKKLREEILIMKKYFLSCRAALQSKLLLQLKSRQHFVENSDMYSLKDLIDVAADELLPQLVKIHASFAQHIKTDCKSCQAKGYKCTLCDDEEALFPFDNHAIVCAKCSTVLHRHCFFRRNQQCPNCDKLEHTSEEEMSPREGGRSPPSERTHSPPNPFLD